MKALSLLFTIFLALLFGCSQRVTVGTVEVIDTSLSITPRAEQATIDAVRTQIGRMQRGDVLVLVPITGDESNDAGGRTLFLQAPTIRESYDADLRSFRKDAAARFTTWVSMLGAEREKTDILGSLDLARQEIDALPSTSERRLVVVSDFLEDDGQYRFTTEPSLVNRRRAEALAARLRAMHGFAVHGVAVCLGRLESADFPSLSPERKAAVAAFWAAYLAPLRFGPTIQIDPTGTLAGSNVGCFSEQ
ncbi:MAG: hypothetical protein WB524_22950 [Acidobacteriaceae bacterium]